MKIRYELTKIARKFADDQSGATSIEYALIGAIVGIGLVASVTNLSTGLTTNFASTGAAVAT